MATELTMAEKALLFILLAEGRELPNTVLTNHYRVKLETASRDRLKVQGLIRVEKKNRRVYLELDDLGAKRAIEEFDAAAPAAAVPAGAGAVGAALYAILGVIKRNVHRSGQTYQDFFAPPVDRLDPAEIEARVRAAYGQLARKPGAWVKLTAMRPRLADIARADLDRVLVAMSRQRGVDIIAELHQETLTPAEREAAVVIGGQDKHEFAIGA